MAGTVFLYFVAIIIPVVVVVLVLVSVMVVEHKFIGTLSTESHSQTVHENYFQCLAGTVFIFFHFAPFIIIPVVVVLVLVMVVVIDDVVIVGVVQANFPEVGLTYAIITAE